MISTFKQFWASIRNPDFGQVIVSRSFKNALWYWTRIFLTIMIIPTILALFAVTYFTPQLPRFVQKSVPEGSIGVADGQLETSLTQPWQFKSEDFTVNIDPFTDPESITEFPMGITVLKDRMIIKDDTTTTSQTLSDIPNFQLSKTTIADFLTQNKSKIWFYGLAAVLALSVVLGTIFWLYNFASFFVVGLIYLVLSKIMHTEVPYNQLVKLAIYSSTITFVFSSLFGLAPGGFSFLINTAIILYFGHRWLKTFPTTIPPVTQPSPKYPIKPTKPSKPSKSKLIA